MCRAGSHGWITQGRLYFGALYIHILIFGTQNELKQTLDKCSASLCHYKVNADCNGYRIIKLWVFTLVSYKPRFHCTILFACRHTWKERLTVA